MSEYTELIKNFNCIRAYIRDFFVFGFKKRNDFSRKSGRTYDNERRRIENYLGDFTKWEYGKEGKNIFISVDSLKIPGNPFYKAYESKSFTGNDLLLHFLLLDILEESSPLPLDSIADQVNDIADKYITPQTIRNKLKEYVVCGLFRAETKKKSHLYSINPCYAEDLHLPESAIHFFSEISPFGIIGHYLANRLHLTNNHFRFKHHFVVHALDTSILYILVTAIKEKKRVEIENFNGKKKLELIPLKIYTSVQTGRSYFIGEKTNGKGISICRLDRIKTVTPREVAEPSRGIQERLNKTMRYSLSGPLKNRKPDRLEMTLAIDEEKEPYVLDRLLREKRDGKVEKIKNNTFRYTVTMTDVNELTPWIKTFLGRIICLNTDNRAVHSHFHKDVQEMYAMYRKEIHCD